MGMRVSFSMVKCFAGSVWMLAAEQGDCVKCHGTVFFKMTHFNVIRLSSYLGNRASHKPCLASASTHTFCVSSFPAGEGDVMPRAGAAIFQT